MKDDKREKGTINLKVGESKDVVEETRILNGSTTVVVRRRKKKEGR